MVRRVTHHRKGHRGGLSSQPVKESAAAVFSNCRDPALADRHLPPTAGSTLGSDHQRHERPPPTGDVDMADYEVDASVVRTEIAARAAYRFDYKVILARGPDRADPGVRHRGVRQPAPAECSWQWSAVVLALHQGQSIAKQLKSRDVEVAARRRAPGHRPADQQRSLQRCHADQQRREGPPARPLHGYLTSRPSTHWPPPPRFPEHVLTNEVILKTGRILSSPWARISQPETTKC